MNLVNAFLTLTTEYAYQLKKILSQETSFAHLSVLIMKGILS